MALCYKDRGFCIHKECKMTECYRFCSKQTIEDANKFGLPIAYFWYTECPHFPEELKQ